MGGPAIVRACSSITPPRREPAPVRVFLAETGVAYDTIEVSLTASAHLPPEHARVSARPSAKA